MPTIIGLEVPEAAWTFNTLRAYLLRAIAASAAEAEGTAATLRQKIELHNEIYMERFDAADRALAASLLAQKEMTHATFAASLAAIDKAEQATASHFAQVDEFRKSNLTQIMTFMPRSRSNN
jgi:hypothetical protein